MNLSISGISKSIHKFKVLDNISFEFTQGLHLLLGSDGVGKTTLIKLLAGNIKRIESLNLSKNTIHSSSKVVELAKKT